MNGKKEREREREEAKTNSDRNGMPGEARPRLMKMEIGVDMRYRRTNG